VTGKKRKPILGVTAGDPAGIGPEILAAALARFSGNAEIRIIGNASPIKPGHPTETGTKMAIEALEEAAHLALHGAVDAIVTGPVSKTHLHRAGFAFPGQTEFFAARAGTENFAMILTGKGLTVGLATIHIPVREIANRLTEPAILQTATLLADFLTTLKNGKPRVAVAGLNPHAGENGDIGREEIELIGPAIAKLQARFPGIFSGPHSPDTVFSQAVAGTFDGVLCMYHDQGLIPLKLHAFDQGVNVSWGLPFLRTSPDHGTAFDLAGKKLARPDSMIAALDLAVKLQDSLAASRNRL